MGRRIDIRAAVIVGVALSVASPALAQRAVSHQTLSLTIDQAAGLTTDVTAPSGDTVTACRVTVESAPIRYWTDGTSPTPTSGHLVNAGVQFPLMSYPEASLFKAIATNGTSTLQVTCIRGAGAAVPAFDASLLAPNTQSSVTLGQVIEGVDPTRTIRAVSVNTYGELAVATRGVGLPLPPCNPVRTTNCQPKGY